MVSKSIEDQDKLSIIIGAAQKRFGHYGLSKTTMSEIADDIGLSKASLYYYFPDKDALFKAVIEKEHNEFVAEIQKSLQGTKDAEKLLLNYIKKRTIYFRKFLNLAKLSFESLNNAKPVFNGIFMEMYAKEAKLVEAMLRAGIESGLFRKLDVSYHAELFSVTMRGLRSVMIKKKEIALLDEDDHRELEKHTVNMTNIFIKGISK